MRVEYSSNNSGGSWWLNDADWLALEEAGWVVDWYKDQDRQYFRADEEGRWLGALASNASREGLSLEDAIREWESVTGQRASALGCNCCGTPHYFTMYDGDKWVGSYSPEYPAYGDDYY